MRKGSALLIVLGMLSFMVVSAVGFSMFMRQSRLPSSYLRRNVSARYLVKAALANAIEELDGGFMSLYDIGEEDGTKDEDYEWGRFFGVYDDPYPGCGPDSEKSELESGERVVNNEKMRFCRNGDLWVKRVFCPFGPLDTPRSETDALNKLPLTVPTMTLEALAYLPPAIIDDVRLMSRMTRTAQWHTLPYEAGRYAYTAVNVSDLFDINRLRAGEPRDSGANRITLASLGGTAADQPFSIDQNRLDSLDTLLDSVYDNKINGKVVPFVSLADFALSAAGTPFSPFTQYIGNSASYLLPNGDAAVANAMFITDSWFPPTNSPSAGVVYDLAGGHQPFKAGAFGTSPAAKSFLDVEPQKNPQDNAGEIFSMNLGMGLVCLYDYLDRDSVPLSLCLPTTEAVPMVAGVEAPAGLHPVIDNIGEPDVGEFEVDGFYVDQDGNQVPTKVKIRRTCQRKGITSLSKMGSIMVKCLATYPFKRMVSNQRRETVKYRGMMRVWLAPEGMGCRPHIKKSLAMAKEDGPERNGIGLISDKLCDAKYGVATLLTDSFLTGKTLEEFKTDVKTCEDAVKSITLQFSNSEVNMPVYWEIKEEVIQDESGKTKTAKEGTYKSNYLSIAGLNDEQKEQAVLRPLAINGDYDNEIYAGTAFDIFKEKGITELLDDKEVSYRLYAAVWVQVTDENDHVVDMVPAALDDDTDWLDGINYPGDVSLKCGDGAPLLNFMSTTPVEFKASTLASTLDVELTPDKWKWKSLYVVDPRYNFAPEDWFSSSDMLDGGTWLSFLKDNYWKDEPYVDRDPFMFVSNQEYLQDIGELQFLPFVQTMNGNKDNNAMTGEYSPDFHGESFAGRTDASAKFANGNRFWRTYTAYNNYNDYQYKDDPNGGNPTPYDPIYTLPYNNTYVRFHSSARGFKVNPYSNDNRILSAAFAMTPIDYYIASTNVDPLVKKVQDITFDQLKSTYGFGGNSLPSFSADQLLGVQDVFRGKVGEKGWPEAWQELEWQENSDTVGDDNKRFLGMDFLGMHGVDRKFLYSYWRECFDNRQQLFLIFVRAEPAAIGGGAAGNISSAQLGGRAVALVWRDPASPGNHIERPKQNANEGKIRKSDFRSNYKCDHPPHRTRVLFYHQFD